MNNITAKEMVQKAKEHEPYENKWAALVDDKVVASSESPQEVKERAEKNGYTAVVFHRVPSFSKTYIFLHEVC